MKHLPSLPSEETLVNLIKFLKFVSQRENEEGIQFSMNLMKTCDEFRSGTFRYVRILSRDLGLIKRSDKTEGTLFAKFKVSELGKKFIGLYEEKPFDVFKIWISLRKGSSDKS
jgi:hypothetical protein